MAMIETGMVDEADNPIEVMPAVAAAVADWFLRRIEGLKSRYIEELFIEYGTQNVRLESFYDDYCRGCYMGRITKAITIPFAVFFSGKDLGEWQREEQAREEAELARQRHEAEQAKAAAQRLQQLIDTQKKEEHDRQEYQRLKTKYEGA